jgi:RING-variant domain
MFQAYESDAVQVVGSDKDMNIQVPEMNEPLGGSFLPMNESKYCRICLEEEDTHDSNTCTDDRMIAPCLCKGGSKWVHRSCLDHWRMNERDRAFAKCTECQFTYHLLATSSSDHPSTYVWNQPRMKFYFFVTRDICAITIMTQLLIGLFGYGIMILDKSQHWDLTRYFNGREHEIAIYYLFGIIALLVMIGMIGSIIFCRNGCRLPSFTDDDEVVEPSHAIHDHNNMNIATVKNDYQYNAVVPVTNIPDIERGATPAPYVNDQQAMSSVNQMHPRHQRHSSDYYRRQRYIDRNRNRSDDCDTCTCCLSTGRVSRQPGYWYNTGNHCTDIQCCCNICSCIGDDSGCCCMCPDDVSSSAATNCDRCDCGNGDGAMACILFVVLVFFVFMAIFGLFLLLVVGVAVFQRIVQRYIFLLQKKTLVQEFQVVDLSSQDYHIINMETSTSTAGHLTDQVALLTSTLHPDDAKRLQKLGLLDGGSQSPGMNF